MNDRERLGVKLFCAWTAVVGVIPVATWLSLQRPSDGLGLLLVLRLGGGAIALFAASVAALVVGFATRTVPSSLSGVAFGLVVGMAVISIIEQVRAAPAIADRDQREAEVAIMVDAVKRGDRSAIAIALVSAHYSMPDSVCLLADRSDREALSTSELFLIGEAVVASTASTEDKESVLHTVLRALTAREPAEIFPAWIALWRRAHEPQALTNLEIKNPSNRDPRFCAYVSSEALAETAFYRWGDRAVVIWLKQGLGFLPEQHRFALGATTRASTLAAVIASGVDPQTREVFYSKDKVLLGMAGRLSSLLDDATSHGDAVEAAKALIRYLGTSDAAQNARACENFNRAEREMPLARLRLEATPEGAQSRGQAASAVQSILCGTVRQAR